MKAFVFKKGRGQYPEDGEEVTHVILVPNNSPSLEEVERAYNKFHHKKMEQVSNQLERLRKSVPRTGIPIKTKEGHYTQHFLNRFEEMKRQKGFDMQSWIIKKYKGKLLTFEAN
jgi:hypothetical protein